MKKNTNQQRSWSRLGVKLMVSVAILAATIVPSPTNAQAFTLIEQPASHLYVFAPMDVGFDQMARLNAANVFCPTAVERVLFKFFDGEGRTLMEEIKSVPCGEVASSELPFIERTDGGSPRVYGLIAVLPAVQRPGNAQRGFCPSDSSAERSGPPATSLELIGMEGGVRQTLLPAVQRSCGR